MPDTAGAFYPPAAFYFKVVFAGSQRDTSFQEVSGLSSSMETESFLEGGENRFTHQLPKGTKHPNLVLKRGLADAGSPLVSWCREVLENGLSSGITTQTVLLHLLDEKGSPLASWSFERAFPVKWQAEPFNSTKNSVAIESIELSYTYSTRVR